MSGTDEYEEAREYSRLRGPDPWSPEQQAKLPGVEAWNPCMSGNCHCPAGRHHGSTS